MKVSKVTGEVIGIVVWLISTPIVLLSWLIMKIQRYEIRKKK
jgi:hypothetical protein